ncbi:MAG: hypothetical protein C4560_05290 [Nitrospiraceae bacterium]|nr:MAG: hypothetical protein C4560_05290 [Nitrospiraceae bacterium]
MKSAASFFAIIISIFFVLYGCKDQPAVKAVKKLKTTEAGKEAALQQQPVVQEAPQEEGYIYQQGNRRDPFEPLIVASKKSAKKESGRTGPGTLESYDISEFSLVAVARKGDGYFALLTTPDNRSFTVRKGSIIGLNKGRVEEITKDRVVLAEYSKDFKGSLRPRKITLEFSKER